MLNEEFITASEDPSLPTVSICILSCNRKDKLFTSLVSLYNELDYPRSKITVWVVDNGSTDGSADMVATLFPQVQVIRLPGNIGIGAWNHALSRSTSEYLVLLDDDAYLEANSLKGAIKLMLANPKAGVVALRPVNPETGLDFVRGYPTGLLSFWGCCAVLRKKALDQVGLYDERFFFQAFELDLSIRLRNAGWEILAPRDLLGFHMTGLGNPSPTKFYFSRRNLFWVAAKYLTGWERIKTFYNLTRVTLRYGKGFPKSCTVKAILTGIGRGLTRPKHPIKKELQRQYSYSFAEFISPSQQYKIWNDTTFWEGRQDLYPDVAETVYSAPTSTGKLVVFMHRLNIDGASLMVMQALRSQQFRSKFTGITVVSNYSGALKTELIKLGLKVVIFPFERMDREHLLTSAFEGEITRLLNAHEFFWINTIDHPVGLLSAIKRSKAKGIVFGHESLAKDSAVLAEGVHFDHQKQQALAALSATSRVKLCWPSTSTQKFANDRLKIKNVQLLPYGVPAKRLNISRYDNLDPITFLVTGWYCQRKNQRVMRSIFREIHRITSLDPDRYHDWRVIFLGTPFENREYYAFMERCLEDLPASKITFKGLIPNEDLRNLMLESHFVVIPSLGEALCVTAMEMMVDGGLVIHSDCEGSEDLFEHEKNGFVAARHDSSALCQIILNVLDLGSSYNLNAMSREAANTMKRFSMESYWDRLVATIRGETFAARSGSDVAQPTKDKYPLELQNMNYV